MKIENEKFISELLVNGVEVETQCKSGFCGACKVKVHDLERAIYDPSPVAFVPDGYILACCIDLSQSVFKPVRRKEDA